MNPLRQSDIDFIAGQVVSETIERHGNALIETVAGSNLLTKVAKQYVNCSTDQTQGRMFEIIEMTKFNSAAAKAGSLLRAVTTDQLGESHSAADILIRNPSGDILKKIQAKSYKTASTAARAISNSKYTGMDRLVNSEKKEKIQDLLENRIKTNNIFSEDYKDANTNLKGQTEYGKINSGGTTYDEATEAAKNPKEFAMKMNKTEFLSGAKNAMLGGALAGAFTGGTVTALQGAFKGEFCVKESGKAATNSAARGAIISGISYGLKYLGKNSPIMSGNVVTAMASSAVNITELTYKYLNKKISTDEYIEALGTNAVSCFSGIIMTAAGAALFGPIGAAVAGTVTLIGMKQLYKVFIHAREDLSLAKEARKEAEAFSKALIQQIKDEEELLVNFFKEYELTLVELRELVNNAISDESLHEKTIVSLAQGLNIAFKYETLEEFENFMMSDEDLIL
ncbi:hypothetical protein [Jeotgalibacillus sp. R-1-5s-1]|uniref:hypothetical protein n=1 Tax=Jeotgalibacillus sp. R-1-5s-1 TaxID=2555897 RepID=UPI00106A8DD7|nr:hypothetical protein [Jeotgalibacillus sp. R-1-5s-1]TFD93672.1 hypothetical protein E2491_14645 [Jeotgalibacillus sp. R-1-5s-1]